MNLAGSSYLDRKLLRLKSIDRYEPKDASVSSSLREDLLKLDSNENLCLPITYLQNLIDEAAKSTDPRVYVDEYTQYLSKALSKYLGVSSEQILIGAGSDDLINLIAGTIIAPCDSALVIEPTFSMYRKCLNVYGRTINTVQLRNDFSLDVDEIRQSLVGTNEVVFLCSPNNPSGNQFSREDIRTIIESTEGLVVLDEAYVEFASESLVDFTEEYENIIILRTFSKAFGLAGLRVGYAVTNKKLALTLREHVLLPYPVCTFSLKVAILLLENIDEVLRTIALVQETRKQLALMLGNLPNIRVFPSDSNFLLLEIPQSSSNFIQEMLKLGIKIRNVDWIEQQGNFVRVTVPPVHNLGRVIDCFKEVLQQ